MNKEQAVTYLKFSGFSEEQIKAIEGAFSCPSAGVDCEDCPAYEDAISRQAVLNTLENMDRALDEDRTVEYYKELLRECYKVLPSVTPKPKSEWEHDHEILKAYSDGASAMLDKIREEIKTLSNANPSYWHSGDMVEREEVFEIIDKYQSEIPTGSEGSDKE